MSGSTGIRGGWVCVVLVVLALASSSLSAKPREKRLKVRAEQVVGVWCSSADEGRTCWGIGETYPDGTADACGREQTQGIEFAMTLKWEIKNGQMCETVVKTSHPDVMPPGDRFCSVALEFGKDFRKYRFSDDDKVRTSYRKSRADKWCQPLINGL